MSRLKIAFIPANVSGVMFYRIWQPAEALRRIKGTEVAVLWYQHDMFLMHPWENDLLGEDGLRIRRDIDMACQWADVVVWMGLHTPWSLALFREMKMFHGKHFVTEMDDYIFSLPNANIASEIYKPGSSYSQIALAQMRESDAVIVSTPYLADLYKDYAKAVHVVENSVDLSLWRCKHSPGRRRVTIGWMGGGTHGDDLRMIKKAIFQTLYNHPNARFACLHGWPDEFEGHPQIILPRNADGRRAFAAINKYPAWVKKHKFDIGIAPLEDNNFNRGKSNLRWLEYSAMGVPCVASPRPHFSRSIDHGRTGFLADTHEDWVRYLSALIESENLRRTMGDLAHKEVKTTWTPDRQGRIYREVLEGIVHAQPHTFDARVPDRGPGERSDKRTLVGV
jgi:glycosyltransferase involved in cell wall biosynthesis